LVCGWNTVDMFRRIPDKRKSSFQKALVNVASQSLMMELDKPCRRTILAKERATVVVVYGCSRGVKWVYFENLSTVNTTDLPLTLWIPLMKSITMSAQTVDGTSSGCKSPTGCSCSVLFLWHVAQVRMKSWMSARTRNEEVGANAVERFLDSFMSGPVRTSQDGGHTTGRSGDKDAATHGHQLINDGPFAGIGAFQYFLA
jgi:hypothetical protein